MQTQFYGLCALLRRVLRANFIELVLLLVFFRRDDDDHYDYNVKTDSFNVHVICIDIISTRRKVNSCCAH